MASTTCLSCGHEIDTADAVCPHCGARRKPRLAGPPFWGTRGARQASTIIGIVLALALSAYLGWTIFTHGKGEPVSNQVPVKS
ncbi:MAG: hypothetical protein JWM27_3431 [Gemmatimonadetes bacterium]|nr:hypothetical protein [Gemmatimonadota bacterium]